MSHSSSYRLEPHLVGASYPPGRPGDGPTGVTIRAAVARDCAPAAALHLRVLRSGLFPKLGARFLSRWHQTFVTADHGVALTAVEIDPTGHEHVVGFLIGATDQERHTAHTITRYRFSLGLIGALALLARPRLLLHFMRTRALRYARRLAAASTSGDRRLSTTGPDSDHGAALRVGVVTAVAVDPGARRSGVGRALLDDFVQECRARGAVRAELVAAAGNTAVTSFYTSSGWRLVGSHQTRDGVHVDRYRVDLTQRATAGVTPAEQGRGSH